MEIWDYNKYSVGYESIDKQHERLFSIIGEVYDKIITADKSSKAPLLIELLSYTNNHYSDEIQFLLLKNVDNESIIDHIKEHQNNINNLIDIIRKSLIDGDLIIVDVAILLNDWISNHIIKYDIPTFRLIGK